MNLKRVLEELRSHKGKDAIIWIEIEHKNVLLPASLTKRKLKLFSEELKIPTETIKERLLEEYRIRKQLEAHEVEAYKVMIDVLRKTDTPLHFKVLYPYSYCLVHGSAFDFIFEGFNWIHILKVPFDEINPLCFPIKILKKIKRWWLRRGRLLAIENIIGGE